MNWKRVHTISKLIGAVVTVATGLYLVFIPLNASDFTGLSPDSPRGITEIRSAMGGLFTALGIGPIAFRSDAMYQLLGLGYLAIGGVRLVAMFVDGSAGESSNWISLVYEVIFGVLLIIPAQSK